MIRLGLLTAIVLAGVSYILFSVLQLRVGAQPYAVSVQLSRAGGLYSGAYVAYRGVDVGRVSSLSLRPEGVTAHLRVNPGTKIPADSQAAVHDLSAVGEQYLDFTPPNSVRAALAASGPWLHDGSVVRSSSTTVPVTVEDVLIHAGGFTNSVNTVAFSRLLDTLTTTLQGSGPQLHILLDSTERLFSTLGTVAPQANDLIDQGRTLLATAQATNPDVRSFSASLASLTAQLDSSSADVTSLLSNGTAAATQLQALLAADTSSVISLTGHSATVADVADNNQPAVQALLQVLPVVTSNLQGTIGPGTINAKFFLNDSEPTCTYANAPMGEPTAASAPLDLSRTCTSSGPTLQQRGSANAPGVQP